MNADLRRQASLTIPGEVRFIRPAAAFLVQATRQLGIPAANDILFEVAIVEALNNAVQHGMTGGASDTVVCELEVGDRRLRVKVLDMGKGFQVPEHIAPSTEALERGYGLPLIRSVFPEMRAVFDKGRHGVELALTF